MTGTLSDSLKTGGHDGHELGSAWIRQASMEEWLTREDKVRQKYMGNSIPVRKPHGGGGDMVETHLKVMTLVAQ